MNKDDLNREDELRSEYDLNSLKVRKLGPEHTRLVGGFVFREIKSHLKRGQADVALNKLIEFMSQQSDDSRINLDCTAFLIDCGTALKKLEPVTKGISIINNFLEQSSDIEEQYRSTLKYNLSNGYYTQANLFKHAGDNKFYEDALQKAKSYLQEILLEKNNINAELLPNVITNYANCLSELGRVVEAVDQYYDLFKIDQDHAVAMGNCSHDLQKLFNLSTRYNDKLLYESWRLLSQAVHLKNKVINLAGIERWSSYSKCLENLENYILNLHPDGIEALKEWVIQFEKIHTSRKKIKN